MNYLYLLLFVSFFVISCKEKDNNISLKLMNMSLNKENNDFLTNTLISFDFNLKNNTYNNIFFISSIKNDIHRKSRLILVDTVYHKSIDIETGDIHVLRKNQTKRILGSINLINEESKFFFDNKYDNSSIKNRSYTLSKLNDKFKSCKIYYIQNEDDIDIMTKQGYKNISFIKDSLKIKSKLFIRE